MGPPTPPQSTGEDLDYSNPDSDSPTIDDSNYHSSTSTNSSSDDNDDLPGGSIYFAQSPTLDPKKKPIKRPYTDHVDISSAAKSPANKKPRTSSKSSIHIGLESKKPQGILNYFKQATESEHRDYLAKMNQDARNNMEVAEWEQKRAKMFSEAEMRLKAKNRKRKQREREKKKEIRAGLRSPGGTKIVVSVLTAKGSSIESLH